MLKRRAKELLAALADDEFVRGIAADVTAAQRERRIRELLGMQLQGD